MSGNEEEFGLRLESIGKFYGKRPVLKEINLEVKRGEAVGIFGPNGAGKTTCFYIITGLIKPDYGKVFLNDEEITNLPIYMRARLGIGYLPQESSIFRGLTVEENIMAILEITEDDLEKRLTMLDGLLAEFGIAHLRETPSIALSGGERRRLEIARSLASKPTVMLLDEPLAGIDPIAVGDIVRMVSHLKSKDIGVLITDHNVRDTLEIVDKAYIISDGMVIASGKPEEIVEHEEVRRVYLGENFNI